MWTFLHLSGWWYVARERERDKLYGKHHSSRAPLWLGNKTLRTRWYQVDLPVLLLASSVAWLRNGFLRAERGGVCVWGRPRVCLCERTDASMVPVRVCDQPIVPLKRPDRAGRDRRETLCICVCVSPCMLLQLEGCLRQIPDACCNN